MLKTDPERRKLEKKNKVRF
ncbi:hypothetical protein [Sicyoidochytrium minutum DNA virus]|nr:hypothetical protein [Sicyoidochytrium minutum DNA virus]